MMKRKYPILAVLLALSVLFPLSAGAAAERPDSLRIARSLENSLLDAVAAYDAHDFQEAKKRLGALVKADPANDAAWYWLGLAESSLGELDAAVEHLRQAVALDPHNYWYKDRLSTLHGFRGEEDETLALYEELFREYPKKTDLHFRLLTLYVRRGEYEKALHVLQDLENLMGKNEQITSTRYDLYRQLGRPEEAIQALLDYNEVFSSPSILSMLGDWYMDQSADSTALACYDEAIALQSDFVPAVLGRTEVFRLKRRYPEYFAAVGEFVANPDIPASSKSLYFSNVTRQIDPRFLAQHRAAFDALIDSCVARHGSDSTILSTAGIYYYSTERRDAGLALLRRNARTFPESLPIEATYIQAVALSEDWEALKAESRAAWERFPEEAGFLEYHSMAAYNQGDYETVLANARTMLARFPDDTARVLSAYAGTGDIYHLLGREKEAFAAYEKALKIDSGYAPVLNNYAYYLCLSGKKLKKAAAMSKKTVEAEPDNPTYLDTYGWILYLQKKYREAKPLFKHAMLYGGKDNPTILDHYAEVLYALGEYELAQLYWKQARDKNDGSIPDLEERIAKRTAAIRK